MKNVLFGALFLCAVTIMNAQAFSLTKDANLTLSGGYVRTWMSGKYVDEMKDIASFMYDTNVYLSGDGLFIGISYLYTTDNPYIQFESGLRYTQRNWIASEGTQYVYDEFGNFEGIFDFHDKRELNYIDLFVGYKPSISLFFDDILSFRPIAGVGYSFLLSSIDAIEQYYRNNLLVLLGIELVVLHNVSIQVEYNRFFNNSMSHTPGGKEYNNNFLISLGIKL